MGQEPPTSNPASVIGVCTALNKEHLALYAALGLQRDPSRIVTRQARRYDRIEFAAFDGSLHELIIPQPTMMGNNRSAITSTNLLNDFPEVRDLVLVGIAGAVPNAGKVEVHVRLGDVVVLGDRGVVQFDMVKVSSTATEYRYPPRPPSARLLRAAQELIEHERSGVYAVEEHLSDMPAEYVRPDDALDVLHDDKAAPAVLHPPDGHRLPNRPRLFIGAIGSSNTLLKDYQLRNALRDEHQFLAVEMESSGCADACHEAGKFFFAVRGTCDYCNDDKGDAWHEYAAFIAAVYFRCILFLVPGRPQAILGAEAPASFPTGDDSTRSEVIRRAEQPLVEPPAAELAAIPAVSVNSSEAASASQRITLAATPDSAQPSSMDRAEGFMTRIRTLDAQLNFRDADLVAQECEHWMSENAHALPEAVQYRVYACLATHSLTFERFDAAERGSATPHHDRTKRLLDLAQKVPNDK